MVGTQKLAQQDSGNRRAVGAFRFPHPSGGLLPLLGLAGAGHYSRHRPYRRHPLPHLEAQAGYGKMVTEGRNRL